MPKATPQQLDERRVKEAWKRYQAARAKLNAHVESFKDAFEDAYELSETCNTLKKRVEKTCRETGVGIGPITVTNSQQPVFDPDYLMTIFKNRPDVLSDLVVTTRKVQRKVFEKLVQDGELSRSQAKKAVTETKEIRRLTGLPDEIVLP